jgi:hypothetical protein
MPAETCKSRMPMEAAGATSAGSGTNRRGVRLGNEQSAHSPSFHDDE